jgi:hypothetical protein
VEPQGVVCERICAGSEGKDIIDVQERTVVTEFWPELLTTASWQKLQKFKKELKDFVVIGGWAVYLWTGMHKSKDVDILVDFKTLEKLKQKYDLNKNHELKKYEIKFDKFDVDIYVRHFSEFVIPVEELLKSTKSVQGFKILEPEALLILKQSAEIQRRGSPKGEKDAIDILTLLSRTPFKKAKYLQLLKAHKLVHYVGELIRVLGEFDARNSACAGMSFKDFQAWRRKTIQELKFGR